MTRSIAEIQQALAERGPEPKRAGSFIVCPKCGTGIHRNVLDHDLRCPERSPR